jgi:hypothetical protein
MWLNPEHNIPLPNLDTHESPAPCLAQSAWQVAVVKLHHMSYDHVIASHPMNCVSNIEHAIFLLKRRSRLLHFATWSTLIINRKEGREHNRKCRGKDRNAWAWSHIPKCAEYSSEENGRNYYIFLIHQLSCIKIHLGILRLAFVG